MSETLYCKCGDEHMVLVGPDDVPLCITHFQDWLTGGPPYGRYTTEHEVLVDKIIEKAAADKAKKIRRWYE